MSTGANTGASVLKSKPRGYMRGYGAIRNATEVSPAPLRTGAEPRCLYGAVAALMQTLWRSIIAARAGIK